MAIPSVLTSVPTWVVATSRSAEPLASLMERVEEGAAVGASVGSAVGADDGSVVGFGDGNKVSVGAADRAAVG